MNRVAQFIKISFEQFSADWSELYPNDDEAVIREIYSNIKLPQRATVGSAGYDFFLPADIALSTNETIVIPTGICVKIDEGWLLAIYPRSGLGFKYRLQLDNTVGIIDSDYYYADNGGHIKIKLTNDGKKGRTAEVAAGKAFAQGIFTPYGITYDDSADGVRTGGFGSTDRQ